MSEQLLNRKKKNSEMFSIDLESRRQSYCRSSGHLGLKRVRHHADATQAALTEHSRHQSTTKNTREIQSNSLGTTEHTGPPGSVKDEVSANV